MSARLSPERDARLLRFDFLSEVADGLVMAGAALSAGASAENLFVAEAALRSARAAVVEGVAAFREIEGLPE